MNGDFSIMDIASGEASTVLVFGIGGLSKDALVLEAKKDMYRNYPLQEGQIYANITVDYKRGFYIFVVETTVTVSADIIQFSPLEKQKENDVFSDLERKTAEKKQTWKHDDAKPIDEEVGVFVGGEIIKMTVKKESGKKRYELEAADSSKFIYKKEMVYFFENKGRFWYDLDVGDKVMIQENETEKSGIIVGLNHENLLIQIDDGIREIPRDEIINDQ
jgi:hypothetical protein